MGLAEKERRSRLVAAITRLCEAHDETWNYVESTANGGRIVIEANAPVYAEKPRQRARKDS